jgi:hypothetical protein
VQIVGESNVNNIVAGYTEPVSAQGGSNYSIAEVIGLLTAALQVGKTIYSLLKGLPSNAKKPSFEDIKKQQMGERFKSWT